MSPSVTIQRTAFEEDYLAISAGVALLDLSAAGKLEISGANAAQFLNGLVSNDIKSLSPGAGVLAAFLTIQGKVLAIARIYRKEASFLIEIEPSNREKIFRNLSRFVPAGGFDVEDKTTPLALLSLQGPRSADFVATLIDRAIAETPLSHIEAELGSTNVLLTRHARAGSQGFDLYVPTEALEMVRKLILTSGTGAGVRAIGIPAFDAARIDAGIPHEPEEVNESRILLEAGFDQAVSYTKGCYLGQEIIARIHWRGQPARQLRRLAVTATELPAPGTELYAPDDKKVGEITSAAEIPRIGDDESRMVALGYVHRNYLTETAPFTLKRDGVPVGEAIIRG